LSDEDQYFLRYAFEFDVPMEMQQQNPKRGKSRPRYEKYKLVRTLREAKRSGAPWGDLLWGYARGYIDFHNASANVTTELLEERRLNRGVPSSPAAKIDSAVNVVLGHPFGAPLRLKSIQKDYAVMAMDHIEELSH
jgi:hypothetical protein